MWSAENVFLYVADSGAPDGAGSSVARQGKNVQLLVRDLPPGTAARLARRLLRKALSESDLAEGEIGDAELVVAEVAANSERHARPPYELRICVLAGVPVWCEIVDGDPDLGWLPALLHHRGGPGERSRRDAYPSSGCRDGQSANEDRETDGCLAEGRGDRVPEDGVAAGWTCAVAFAESGRGLPLVRELAQGCCRVYTTTVLSAGVPGKAVGFGLPTPWGERLRVPPLPALDAVRFGPAAGAG